MSLKTLKISPFLLIFCIFAFLMSESYAQNKKPQVRVSPKASVSQTVGFTEITISYSRPGVKGRKIWGGLVPFGKVWRTGANEATKITFSRNVSVNGHNLPAGSYAFFAIPGQREWTLIFNKVADQWGAFSYDKNKDSDALKIQVAPVKNEFKEWLKYTFSDMNVQKAGMKNSAVVNLEWDNLRVPFTVETMAR